MKFNEEFKKKTPSIIFLFSTVHPRSPANTVSTLAIFINFSLALTDLANLPGGAGLAGALAASAVIVLMPLLFFDLRLCFAAKLAHATDLTTVVELDISTSSGRMQKLKIRPPALTFTCQIVSRDKWQPFVHYSANTWIMFLFGGFFFCILSGIFQQIQFPLLPTVKDEIKKRRCINVTLLPLTFDPWS